MSILPRLAATDAVLWMAWLLAVAWLPGVALRRVADLQTPERCERWTLTAILGILWACWTYYLLAAFGAERWHLGLAIVPDVLPVPV